MPCLLCSKNLAECSAHYMLFTLPKNHIKTVCINNILCSATKKQSRGLNQIWWQAWAPNQDTFQPGCGNDMVILDVQWPRELSLVIKAKNWFIKLWTPLSHAPRNMNPKDTSQNILLMSHWLTHQPSEQITAWDTFPTEKMVVLLYPNRTRNLNITHSRNMHTVYVYLLVFLHKLFEIIESNNRCCLAAKVPN